MDDAAHLRRRIIVGLLVIMIACPITGGVALLFQKPPIRSEQDQVAFVLRAQGVAYRRIELGQRYPAGLNPYYGRLVYPLGVGISVQLHDGRLIYGAIKCPAPEQPCDVTLRDIGIIHVELPPFSPPQRSSWIDRIAPYLPAGLRPEE